MNAMESIKYIDRKEWLKERLNGIGGSDVGIILGVSPFKSRLELWNEKVEKKINNSDELIFKIGHVLEPIIADEYSKMTGRVLETRLSKTHPLYPFMIGNVDREIVKSQRPLPGICEIKTKGQYTHWKDNEIPLYIHAQIQHYMAIYGYTWGSIVVLDLGTRTITYTDIERDDKLISELIEEESKFWNLVQNKIPPKVEGGEACEKYLKNKYSKQVIGKTIDLTSNKEVFEWVIKLKQAKDKIKELEIDETEAKNHLMNIMGDAELGLGENFKITWKNDKDSVKFDEEKFKEDNPSLYSNYLELKKGIRRFLLKFDKSEKNIKAVNS